MKQGIFACLGLALASTAHGVQFQSAAATPMAQVVQLLTEMKEHIESDGLAEQKSYDKYACWCEDTLARKARDISNGKEKIEELGALIVKLDGEIAAHGAEIQQLQKDIQQNLEAQGEAKAVRDGEFEDYDGEKTESEQCLGALEAAIKALAGAGTGKFLETSVKQAELLSVVAGVRAVMARPSASRKMSGEDLALVRRFVDKPEDFVARRSTGFAQVGNNPFGDYAPQSTQIQGILKGMYDTFASDLEKANAKEAEAQKGFEALMATKIRELETLQATHKQHELDHAQKSQKLAESHELLDATQAQLEADEQYFDETKNACQVKSQEWNERTRLRTMELAGVAKAIEILSSPEAKETFERATSTFVQLASIVTHRGAGASSAAARTKAFQRLAGIARRYHNLGLAEIAAKVKVGGHFDKVIESIDRMIEILRAEEQADIEHRDRCQNAQGKNVNDVEDLNAAIDKADKSIEFLGNEQQRLTGDIEALDGEIAKTKSDMDELLSLRNEDVAEFRKALKDDTDAIALLEQAIVAVKRFYEQNNIKLELHAKQPKYTVDADKAPETIWKDGKYGGRKDETTGVVAIMEMLIEDLQNEMKTARADDAEAQKLYESQRGAMKETLNKQMATKLASEKELADVRGQKAATEEHLSQKDGDLKAEKELESALFSDCSWVKTHFETRRTKRKSEMDGLVEAKGYLAGVAAGDL